MFDSWWNSTLIYKQPKEVAVTGVVDPIWPVIILLAVILIIAWWGNRKNRENHK